jgi:hypothetical protein
MGSYNIYGFALSIAEVHMHVKSSLAPDRNKIVYLSSDSDEQCLLSS